MEGSKGSQPLYVGILGGIFLAIYGMIATFQPEGFGRTYAAYGGIFVVMAMPWDWLEDKIKPDYYDIIGAAIILVGTIAIFSYTTKVKGDSQLLTIK